MNTIVETASQSQDWERRPPRGDVSARGIIVAVAAMALLILSVYWLRSDSRYRDAIELTTAAEIIMSNSPLDVDAETIAQGAADGLTSVLDPYSAYLTPTELGLLTEETEGQYRGLGIEIRRRDGRIYIVDVMPQSPAEDVGLRPGDQIVSLDGRAAFDLSPDDLIAIVRGAEAQPIAMTVKSSDGDERFVSVVPREVMINPFPLVGITRSGIGYIRWEHFTDGSGDRLAALVEEMRVEETVGLILDLRGNPGGIVSEAVTAAGLFQPQQSLVCTLVGASDADSAEFRTAALPIYDEPLVVVQDELSSSAAEILAASLRDAGRAVIVGQRSFGKGWVQNIFPLENGGGLKLSTAYYITPSGQRIGDPEMARSQFDSLVNGGQWVGTGLAADLLVEDDRTGPWEDMMMREGLATEYVTANADNWSATGVEDSASMMKELKQWMVKRKIRPDGIGQSILDQLPELSAGVQGQPSYGRTLQQLEVAVIEDNWLQFRREAPGILLRLWEERLRHTDLPDPGELEALIELDPFLSMARDLIEQPERFRSILAGASTDRI